MVRDMQSQDGTSDKQDALAGDAPARSQGSQRWGRGAATALERMKTLEEHHNPSRQQGDRDNNAGNVER